MIGKSTPGARVSGYTRQDGTQVSGHTRGGGSWDCSSRDGLAAALDEAELTSGLDDADREQLVGIVWHAMEAHGIDGSSVHYSDLVSITDAATILAAHVRSM